MYEIEAMMKEALKTNFHALSFHVVRGCRTAELVIPLAPITSPFAMRRTAAARPFRGEIRESALQLCVISQTEDVLAGLPPTKRISPLPIKMPPTTAERGVNKVEVVLISAEVSKGMCLPKVSAGPFINSEVLWSSAPSFLRRNC